MQKVAWPTITVKQAERSMPSTWVKVLLSATPVTIPGRAIGRIDEEGDRLAAEEAVARHGQRGEGAEHERDRGRDQRPP